MFTFDVCFEKVHFSPYSSKFGHKKVPNLSPGLPRCKM